jgi:hypothetical protein
MNPKGRTFRAAGLLLAAGAMLSAGCDGDPSTGYTMRSLYPEDVKSVAVDMFQRGPAVYRREIETRLTKAVVKRIQLDTPYRIEPKASADTVLTGSLELVEQAVVFNNPDTGRPREKEITFTVDVVWKNQRTGEEKLNVRNLRVTGTYLPHEPFSENFYQGSEDLINRLARRIVEQMERPW